MTKGKLITALVLMTIVCLGLSALLLPDSGLQGPVAERLVPLSPSQVAAVEVRPAGAEADTLLRDGPDAWSILLAGQTGDERVRWPADADRVRGFLRILDRLRAEPAEQPAADAPATIVRISGEKGEDCELGLPLSSIAGRSIVQRTLPGGATGAFVTTDELSRLLTRGGLRNWLDTRAFPGAEGQVVGVGVQSAGLEFIVERSPSGWRIQAPFAAPAEASLVEELVDSLRTLPCTPMPDLVVPASDAGASPTTLTLTTERRQALADNTIEKRTRVSTLRTIGPIGTSGVVPATAQTAGTNGAPTDAALGPLTVELDAERLTRAVRRPEFYLARRVLRAAPTDIRGVTIERAPGEVATWTRTDAGWQGPAGPASETDAQALQGLVELLTQRDAPAAAWMGDGLPQGAQILATVRCAGLGGVSIATVQLGVGPSPEGAEDRRMQALLIADGVGRYYSPESTVDVVRWVAPPPPAPKPPPNQ